jgi:hypothetical protein
MSKTIVTIKHLLAVLKFSKSVPVFLVYAKAIYSGMHSSANFTASAAKLAVLNTNIGLLDASQTATKNKPPTNTVAQRDVILNTVKANLRGLQSDAQGIADATPASAEAIILSAAMSVKKVNIRQKQQNGAKQGELPGSADLTGEGAGPHEWRMGTDNINWTYLPATYRASTRVSDLTSLALYYFQTRPILRSGLLADWSESMPLRTA